MPFPTEFVAPAVHRLASLPYWSSYALWIEHMSECQHCSHVMALGSGLIQDLCPEGTITATASHWDIDQQHAISQFN
jgi:hypothetical protein